MLLESTQTTAALSDTHTVPPQAAMLQLLFGKHITYSLSAVARLRVADHMASTPVAVEALAEEIGAQPQALYRVMRLLAAAGVFEEIPGRCFRLTPLGELLKTDALGSLHAFAVQMGDAWSTRSWEHFTETIKAGSDCVTRAFGKNIFELFAEEPEQAENFHRSMSGLSAAMTDPILNAYDFTSIRRLADVGGGHGNLLAAILDRHPGMNGVVYDLPEVVAGAGAQPHLEQCRDRIQFEGGSFFERVPGSCDAYLMKFILHDWSDEHCRTILGCIRQQLSAEGRVLVIEQIVDEQPGLSPAKLLDIEMLALTVGGRERTREEFRELFASAGLCLTAVFPSASPVCILEARPA